jgi:hypothetical protein
MFKPQLLEGWLICHLGGRVVGKAAGWTVRLGRDPSGRRSPTWKVSYIPKIAKQRIVGSSGTASRIKEVAFAMEVVMAYVKHLCRKMWICLTHFSAQL